MSKILLTFLLCFNLAFASEKGENNQTASFEPKNIVEATTQIQTINGQIQILKLQRQDSNASNTSASNLSTLEKRKEKILDKIPFLIMQIDVKQSDIDKFKARKNSVENKVARYEKSGNKKLFAQNAIELEQLRINEAYYTALVKLEELFKKGAKDSQIKDLIVAELLNLQTNLYLNIKDLKEFLGDDTATYSNEIALLELQKQTSEEILTYIKDNATLLSSSFILSELNLKNTIDLINEKIPVDTNKFNLGKTVIIIFVFLFFISLTRLLAKFTYWFISLFAKFEGNEDIKEQILDIVKRPISSILIIYALNTCIRIGYYPVPMPINIANTFSIIYILVFAWLLLTMLNGYGLILIGKIAQKSGRKEVVNLILKIIYFIVLTIAALLVLSRLGFDISALIASLGIGGLAVAFAAKDIIANFFASVMLLFDNSFSQGDWIVCGDIEGTVVEIGLRKTTVRSFDNALIFVPNSKLVSDPIRNWTRRKIGRNIKLTIGLTYNSTVKQLQKCIDDIKNMLLEHPSISKPDNGGQFMAKDSRSRFKQNIVSIDDLAGYKSNLTVALDNLNDSSVDIVINCFAKTTVSAEYVLVKQDIIFKIMQIVEENNLSFAFPSQSLYIENTNLTQDEILQKENL